MTYGTIKVDTVTFTDAGIDKSVTLSGLVQNPTFSGNVTVTGTLSGVTVTGTTANFTSGNFTNISGGTHTITSGVFAAGSAASPSITFTGDLNTGIYSPGADQVAISTSSVGRLFIDASGNVGVAYSSPSNFAGGDLGASAPLVVGDGTGSRNLTLFSANNVYGSLAFADSTTGSAKYAGLIQYYHANDTMQFYTGSTQRMVIDSSGRLGLGTSSPGAVLHVAGGASSRAGFFTSTDTNTYSPTSYSQYHRIYLQGGSATGAYNGIGFTNSSNAEGFFGCVQNSSGYADFVFQSFAGSYAEKMRITSAGNVGIGTTSPSATLQVSPSSGSANFQVSRGSKGLQINQDNDSADPNINTIGATALRFLRDGGESMRIDTSGRLLVGTSSALTNVRYLAASYTPQYQFSGTNQTNTMFSLTRTDGVFGPIQFFNTGSSGSVPSSGTNLGIISFNGYDGTNYIQAASIEATADAATGANDMPGRLVFSTTADGASSPTERMRIDNAGSLIYGTSTSPGADITSGTGFYYQISTGLFYIRSNGSPVTAFNRGGNDGTLVEFKQDQTTEGTISVSGTTVSYNGAHLSRWSQLPSGAERTEILRGTVLSNIDEMCEWDEEDNEQLNRMKVSDVEGDKNVSGVFQAWDNDDNTYTNDFYCAMTGDFIIRIGAGITVERGDLLISAGDGTAKPQNDDIIRSKTIAKVTSTNVSCTYDDGSYCVPCVLMAC